MTERAIQKRGPFDPGDAFDSAADLFRRQVAEIALAAMDAKPMKGLPGHRKVEAMVAGVLTGLIGSCFSYVSSKDRKAIMEFIESYLPQAKQTAIEIIENGGHGETGEKDGKAT